MEYWLIKTAKTHHHGRGEVVSAVSTIASTITVQETTALLVAYSQVAQADPSESCPRLDSDEPCKLRSYPPARTHHWLHVASFIQMLVHNWAWQTFGSFKLTHTSPDIHTARTTDNVIHAKHPHAEHSAHGPGYKPRKQRLDITIQLKRAMARQYLQLFYGHNSDFWQFWLADIPFHWSIPSVHSIVHSID